MSYDQTTKDIEATIGTMPGFMKAGIPQDVLVQMWPIMKKYVLGQSTIPQKYREMIALASAATMKCPYCEAFHRGAARMYGATEEELKEVGALVGQTTFWSSVLHAQNYDINAFMKEFQAIGEHLTKQASATISTPSIK